MRNIKFTPRLVGKLNVSFMYGNKPSKSVIVFIPGGPGLSNTYLRPFMHDLFMNHSVDLALIDLPNHDNSRHSINERVDFDFTKRQINATINEIATQYETITIFAHSLGGVFLCSGDYRNTAVTGIYLCDVPAKLTHSKEFIDKLKLINNIPLTLDSEQNFSDRFFKISKLYFNTNIPQETLTELFPVFSGQKGRKF